MVEWLERREPGVAERLGIFATGKGRIGVRPRSVQLAEAAPALSFTERAASHVASLASEGAFSPAINPDRSSWKFGTHDYRKIRGKHPAKEASNPSGTPDSRLAALLATPYLDHATLDIVTWNDDTDNMGTNRDVATDKEFMASLTTHLPGAERSSLEHTPDEAPGRRALQYQLSAITFEDRILPVLRRWQPSMDIVTGRVPMAIDGETHGAIRRLQTERCDFYLLDPDDAEAVGYLVDDEAWQTEPDGIIVDGSYASELIDSLDTTVVHTASVLTAHQSWLVDPRVITQPPTS